jgi:hypothetical protein
LVELLFVLLKKRPKQYQDAIKKGQELLGKISEKLVKSKQLRQNKKEKIKQKMETGEYLPKEVYVIQREHKRDKVLADMKNGKKRREKEIKKKIQQSKFEKIQKSSEPAAKNSREGRSNAAKEPEEESFKPVKRYEPRKFVKGEQVPEPNSAKPSFQRPQRGADQSSQYKKPAKPSHPSWEAKKEMRKLETSIKFIKGEEIEL